MGLVKDMDGVEEGKKRDEAIQQNKLLVEIYEAIRTGAKAFLKAEYTICVGFCALFALVIFSLVSWGQSSTEGWYTAVAFSFGALTSILSGYVLKEHLQHSRTS